ncbi:MAG: hypothetical protein V4547_17800 [Bacteroidota bacterium]
MNKRLVYGVLGVGLLTYAGYGWYQLYKSGGFNLAKKPDENKPVPSTTPATQTNSQPTKPATATPTNEISADEAFKKGPTAVNGKMLIAKNDAGTIYDTTLKPVGKMIKGMKLGKAFIANKLTNGSYNIKYQDDKGNYRIVNSVSVNVA